MKFKTNINCGSCIAAVTPTLNALAGQGNWQVNTDVPLKILSIEKPGLTAAQVEEQLAAIGYQAKLVAES